MNNQLEGYTRYLEKCAQYGLEPVTFRHFVMQLTSEQLQAFNKNDDQAS